MNISAIIPAYNEEERIGKVLSVLIECDFIKEIIVVNDGSTDKTSKEASRYSITIIDLPINLGKGAAMMKGVEESTGEWVLFLDADLKGLTKEHIISMVEYIKYDNIDMIIGRFTKGNFITDISHKILPCLSGQRLIRREILTKIPHLKSSKYGVEITITKYILKKRLKVKKVDMPHLRHIPKEKKRGWIKGKIEKYSMYFDIISSLFSINRYI
ncbi:glycosyltransferase family 2 protein [Defluviitalea phaphyphila]|uniref:glycosyltransferase family 2 protein n=1 Tax=Defluviitalea phaphyphila TaxID=1473580 RepID=UPI000730D473|nr:glycosyltransferase family 2 protein [Defluviitalea phaphyphila]